MNKYSSEIDCADAMIQKIQKICENLISGVPKIQGAIVAQVNENGTVNVYLPGEEQNIYTNIQNQSIYQDLKPGDEVEILLKNGRFSNCWIIAKHNNLFNPV